MLSTRMKIIYILIVLILAFGSLATAAFAQSYELADVTSFESLNELLAGNITMDGPTVIAGDCDAPVIPIC